MVDVALGVLLAIGIIVVVLVALNLLVAAWVFLWSGIDDYGPIKHWWKDRRR